MKLKVGMKVKGIVTGVQPYGIFVNLKDDNQGLIHISECKFGYVKNIEELFKVGDNVEALIIDIDVYSGKISLSLRSRDVNLDVLDKRIDNRDIKKRYWSNYHLKVGFNSIKEQHDQWIDEAERNLKISK